MIMMEVVVVVKAVSEIHWRYYVVDNDHDHCVNSR